jgi:hypothetical protein
VTLPERGNPLPPSDGQVDPHGHAFLCGVPGHAYESFRGGLSVAREDVTLR